MFQIDFHPMHPETAAVTEQNTCVIRGATIRGAVSNFIAELPGHFDDVETLAEVMNVLAEAVDDIGPGGSQADNRSFPGDPDAFEIVITPI
jgi:hypothetical protein